MRRLPPLSFAHSCNLFTIPLMYLAEHEKDHSERKHSHSRRRKRHESSDESYSSDSSSESSSSSSSSSDDRRHKRHKHKHKSRKSKKPPGAPTLTKDDYFRYASEYREWMLSSKGIHTSALNTDKARAMFSSFVKAWNKGKLNARYYDGIEPTSISSTSRSDHRWSFAGVDPQHLASIRNEVNRATSAGKSSSVSDGGAREMDDDYMAPYAGHASSSSASVGPSMPPMAHGASREDKEREYERLKRERKDFRRDQKSREEELAPRASGRERVLEKRKEENYSRRTHEAQRYGDVDVDPFDESAHQSITSHVRAQEAAVERRRQEKSSAISERVAVAQAKEDQVMERLRELARNSGHRI